MQLRGWRLTGAIFAGLLVMSLLVLALAGTGEEGVRVWIRATARSSATLFLLAFGARPLRELWRSGVSAFLLRERRYIGVSAALSHAIHLTAIVWLSLGWPEAYVPDPVTLVVGGAGFAFFFAMAATSSDRAVAWLGRRNWRRLHLTGGWLIWFIFTFTFVPDAERGWDALHAFAVVACLGLAALRFATWARSRRRAPAAAV